MASNRKITVPIRVDIEITGETATLEGDIDVDLVELTTNLSVDECLDGLAYDRADVADWLGREFVMEHFGLREE